MKLSNRIITGAFSLVLLASLCGCGDGPRAAEYITGSDNMSYTAYADDKTEYQLNLSDTDAAYLQGYEKKQENNFLALYYQPDTAYIAVADKRSGKVWYSVSPELESDSVVQDDTKKLLCSPLQVEYKELQAFKSVSTFTNSVEDGNFSSEDIENGVAVKYTFTDVTKASAAEESADKSTVTEPKKLFDITVEYTLDNESLIVNIPLEKISYTEDYPPLSIKLLQDFGSSREKDGYLMVPDGSGALIYFNSEKGSGTPFLSNVYGLDKTLEITTRPNKTENTSLPVFGLKEKDNGFLAIIEDSEATASIGANPAGMLSERNEVFASFQTLAYQKVSIGSTSEESKFVAVQDSLYGGNIRVRYAFLKKGEADYADMAAYYRGYLEKNKGIEKLDESDFVPLNIEMVGSIDKIQSFLGINYNGSEALTTFSQARDILEKLLENGIENINVKYSGWLSGGLEQDYAGKSSVLSNLGGESGLKELADFTKENRINLYPSVSLLTSPSKSKGFNTLTMSAKQLDQNSAKYYSYDSVSLSGTDYRSILSPSALIKSTDSFFEKYSKIGIGSVCVEDIASEVFADYSGGSVFDRQAAVNLYSKLLKEQSEQGSLMINGSYAYAANEADVILNVPVSDSGYNVTDESIPFYQIVYHGYKDYSAAPLNSAFSITDDMLKSVEYGAAPYFKVMSATGSATKNTDYSYLCSNNFETWEEDIASYYEKMNGALAGVRNCVITGHGRISENVYQTVYENGTRIIVNYSDTEVTVGDTSVAARDFTVVKGAD